MAVRHPLFSIAVSLALAGTAHAALATNDGSTVAEATARGDAQAVRALIERKADVNLASSDGTPPLTYAVWRQDAALVKALLEAGAKADEPSRLGMRPLHLAIANADIDSVRLLLAAGADANSRDGTGDTSLMMAARIGRDDIVDALLERHAQVDLRDTGYGQTALMVASREGHANIAERLLARGAKPDAQSQPGKTPAFRLPASNAGSKGAGIVRGGWPDRGERDSIPGAKTPLLYAARENHRDIVAMLLDAGAPIEQADADGVTPLLMAVLNGAFDSARLLIERGANVNAMDWYGQTPLFSAVDWRNLDVPGPTRDNGVDRAAALSLVQLLVDKGANVNARTRESLPVRRWVLRLGSLSWADFTGQTPFFRAAFSGDVTVMRLLLAHGADAKLKTDGGTTPMMAAAGVNWTVAQTFDEGPAALLEAVKICWEQGNDVNAVNSMGLQAVHAAANRGSDDIIRFLVDKGATLQHADAQGRTPVVWAKGVFLATHPPEAKPATIALIETLSTRHK
ncbi:MAG: ankyrin repeat domain-containing protein [Steroidobacteraceae bacterium]